MNVSRRPGESLLPATSNVRVETISAGRLIGGYIRQACWQQLDVNRPEAFPSGMGRLLDRLIRGSSAYEVKRDVGGFILVGRPDRLDEFSQVVSEAAAQSGEDFVVFATTDGGHRYSQMYIMPFDENYSSPPPS